MPGSIERRYLGWSFASVSVQTLLVLVVVGLVGESVYWTKAHDLPLDAIATRWTYKLGRPVPFPELVEIPAGQFMMGSESGRTDERPVHQVTILEPFYLGATEVTFA
jgi:formylglycine-generating enzyme required for sulfatase activity